MSNALLGAAAAIFAVGFVVLVWRKGFGELSFSAGKVNAKLTARDVVRKLDENREATERIERAVNHVAPGEPPLIDRVMKIEEQQNEQMSILEEIRHRLDRLDSSP